MSPQPKTFTRKHAGQVQTRVAHTPAEEVRLKFAGWTEQKTPTKPDTPPAKSTDSAKPTDTK